MHIYHATEIEGIKLFAPKLYWHFPDFNRSGIFKTGETIPDGALLSNCFFAASREIAPIFFSNKNIYKHAVCGVEATSEFLERHGIVSKSAAPKILFDVKNQIQIESTKISVYEFTTDFFTRVDTGEWVTDQMVEPIRETVYSSSKIAMERFGWEVYFSNDVEIDLRKKWCI